MNKLLKTVLSSSTILAVFCCSGQVLAQSQCNQAVESVKQDLSRRGYFSPANAFGRLRNPEVRVNNRFIVESFHNYPSARTTTVEFVLTDTNRNSISNLYNFPQLMTTLASQIINSCDGVGLVYFCYFIEGGVPVGYFPNNTIRPFTIFDPSTPDSRIRPHYNSRNKTYQWGYFYGL